MSSQAYWTGSHDDFLLWGRRSYQLSITNSAKHSSQTYRRAGQRFFGLLALIIRPQVRYIHLPKRMILPRSLIPSHKYILKNLTFVVRTHSCVNVTTLVKSFTWPEWRSITEIAMSFLAYWTGSHDDFLLLGRRLYQPSITKSAKHSSQTYRRAGQRCFGLLAVPLYGTLCPALRSSAVPLYGTFDWSALYSWWWRADIASDPTRGSRHDFPSSRPGRTLLF